MFQVALGDDLRNESALFYSQSFLKLFAHILVIASLLFRLTLVD